MKLSCSACGVEKDMDVHEAYPYAEDGIITGLVAPLWDLDCQGDELNDGTGYCDFRRARVCHGCFHKLQPDLWIHKDDWAALLPVTPFEQLPRLKP